MKDSNKSNNSIYTIICLFGDDTVVTISTKNEDMAIAKFVAWCGDLDYLSIGIGVLEISFYVAKDTSPYAVLGNVIECCNFDRYDSLLFSCTFNQNGKRVWYKYKDSYARGDYISNLRKYII